MNNVKHKIGGKMAIEVKFNAYGEEHTARFFKDNYQNNGNLFIGVLTWNEEWKFWEAWSDLTVNIPPYVSMEKNVAYLDTNNGSRELFNVLFEKGYIVETGKYGFSGYCSYPLVEFSEEFLNGMYYPDGSDIEEDKSMKEITFRYRDEMSKGKWRKQRCTVESVEECIKIYGLGVDCEYEILEVKEV